MIQSAPVNKMTEEILKTQWYHLGKWIEPALAAQVWLEYGHIAQEFFTQKLDGKILYLNGDFFLSQHDVDIIKKESYEAAKSNNRQFFQKIHTKVLAITNSLVEQVKTKSVGLEFLQEYKQLTGVWMPLNIVALGIEQLVQEINPDALKMAKGFVAEKPWTLQQLDEMTSLQKEVENHIGKTIQISKDIPSTFMPKVMSHIAKYEWLGSHHFNIDQLNLEKLVEKMTHAKKEQQIENKPKTDDKLVELLNLIGFVRFRCAETSGYTTFYFKKVLDKIAKKHNIVYEDVVEHTIEEISTPMLSKEIAKKRRASTGFYYNNKEHILSTEEVSSLTNALLNSKDKNATVLKGIVANSGKVTGVVKIVTKKSQQDNFKSGMILVAHETTPDIIFAMQKSAAIVTDFGGLTSHAAIVARELRKPCIVDTKHATHVFKDGDLVEVDATKGIVTLINKTQSK